MKNIGFSSDWTCRESGGLNQGLFPTMKTLGGKDQ